MFHTFKALAIPRAAVYRHLAAVCLGATVLIAGTARADDSCAALLQDKISYLRDNGGWFYTQLSIHRDDFNWGVHSSQYATVSYDPSTGGLVGGNFPLLFSIRYSGQQPFDIHAPDIESWDIGPSGLVHFHNVTWGFDTYYDMACTGSMMTRYFPGTGVVTINFGPWGIIF
jgi:hypothetical protein